MDEAHLAENVVAVKRICPSYQKSGFEIEAMIEEIHGFLLRNVAAKSLDLRQTRQLERLQQDALDKAGEDMSTGPSGYDVVLQVTDYN